MIPLHMKLLLDKISLEKDNEPFFSTVFRRVNVSINNQHQQH